MLDTNGDVGSDTSLTIGTDGLGLIAYADRTNSDLKIAHCYDVNCSAAKIATLDATPNLWITDIKLTIGQEGLGLISYHPNKNASEGDLRVAHCWDVVCSAATTRTVDTDPSGDRGEYAALTIGADGLGLITYKAGLGSGPLKVLLREPVLRAALPPALSETRMRAVVAALILHPARRAMMTGRTKPRGRQLRGAVRFGVGVALWSTRLYLNANPPRSRTCEAFEGSRK
jgi:hypothetical protein